MVFVGRKNMEHDSAECSWATTDGASGITNTDNPAVEHARKCHTEWKVENGIDPEHDWSKNILE